MIDPTNKHVLTASGPLRALPDDLLARIARRALYYSTQMIHQANHRSNVEKGDPKVGGHPAACASSTHILGALHLVVREPQDFMAVKPHAAPMDHAYSHLLGLFTHPDGRAFTEEEAKRVMFRLRAFFDPSDPKAEPAFQSYHAVWDPDSMNYIPSGSVGIPPVISAYTALAYRFAETHDLNVPQNTHFWSIVGDSEFREGSLAECMPDIAERELGHVTWIIDYNRQNLDGTRIINEEGLRGSDADRIEKMSRGNGWSVVQLRHGRKRLGFFDKYGKDLQRAIEDLKDFELQALLLTRNGRIIRDRLSELVPSLKEQLGAISDAEMLEFFEDLGGHDIVLLSEALHTARFSQKPTLIIAHTIKGWGLRSQAMTGNHSMLASPEEVEDLRKREDIPANGIFQRYATDSPEGLFCARRGAQVREGQNAQRTLKTQNLARFDEAIKKAGIFPRDFGINLKLAPWANTQWMWGQLAAKLVRIANTAPKKGEKAPAQLAPEERPWAPASHYIVTMAPDVGTSTNLNPSMDSKVYGPGIMEDFEATYAVKDHRRPDLVPLEKEQHRHLRFEIEEANAMSCLGAFGKMGDNIGVPFLPLMTVYDFFIKRALDQFFLDLYWGASFILVGTPSGVTLSPEGAQHSWKSDYQIPNNIVWEPAYAIEMDWIIADAVRRHFTRDNEKRQGVLVRAVTRGVEQKQLMERLRKQIRFQHDGRLGNEDVLKSLRSDVLEGGYWLVNHEGVQGYAPGDNVVDIFVMGALVTEALAASDQLLAEGIFANVAVVTSPTLLVGDLGRETGYRHLRQGLGISGDLYLTRSRRIGTATAPTDRIETLGTRTDLLSLRGTRIPIVAVCDGEPGLLDNIGSIIGVPQETLGVRKHSKSGRPSDVYRYQHLNAASIREAALAILDQSATENILVSRSALEDFEGQQQRQEQQRQKRERPTYLQ